MSVVKMVISFSLNRPLLGTLVPVVIVRSFDARMEPSLSITSKR